MICRKAYFHPIIYERRHCDNVASFLQHWDYWGSGTGAASDNDKEESEGGKDEEESEGGKDEEEHKTVDGY